MALGRTHDKINLLTGSIVAGVLLGLEKNFVIVGAFVCGWLLATLIFGPDTDVMPKKRTRFLAFFLYPYSLLFRHRGISHSFLLGTITRVLYGIVMFIAIVFVFNKMGYIHLDAKSFLEGAWNYFINFDYSLFSYKLITWFFAGMFVADLFHLAIDKLSDIKNSIKRTFKKLL